MSSGLTFAAWVRPARGERRYPVLVGRAPPRRPPPRSAAAAAATAWRKGVRVDAGLRNGRWSHVALTWDGAVARALRGRRSRPAAGRRRAALGRVVQAAARRRPRAAGAWLRGRIAGAEVHGRALGAAEIAALAGER